MSIKPYLAQLLDKNGSDIHITVGLPIQLRLDGDLHSADDKIITPEMSQTLCYEYLTPELIKNFESEKELDIAIDFEGRARFRVNLFFERGHVAGAFRQIPSKIPTPADLGLPEVLVRLADKPRGLVLVTGPTGSGKSTTLAALLNHINHTRSEHILTIEDPIEFLHTSKKCLVAQREVERDTHSFTAALKRALRQDPDVVLIGEMRDLETIAAAITISETGHLVFATLHTNSAVQTINRIIDVFPSSQQAQVRTQLSFILEGVVSQQLVPKIGGGRALALEIMTPTVAIRNLIREEKIHQIYPLMQTNQTVTGMQTMNQSLADLFKRGLISREDALGFASESDEMKRLMGA